MAAFEAATKLGVDGIETDVRLSADGKPVIIHDRVSPKRRVIGEITHRELESDVGHTVPLLPEILEAFSTVLWNIEIKNLEALPAALPVLKQFQRSRRLLVTSFRHDVVRQCARELDIECGLLIADRPLHVAAIIASCCGEPRIKSIVWDYNILDDSVLHAVVSAGWGNYVYGPVTGSEHQRCANLGLAGLITDYPLHALNRQKNA